MVRVRSRALPGEGLGRLAVGVLATAFLEGAGLGQKERSPLCGRLHTVPRTTTREAPGTVRERLWQMRECPPWMWAVAARAGTYSGRVPVAGSVSRSQPVPYEQQKPRCSGSRKNRLRSSAKSGATSWRDVQGRLQSDREVSVPSLPSAERGLAHVHARVSSAPRPFPPPCHGLPERLFLPRALDAPDADTKPDSCPGVRSPCGKLCGPSDLTCESSPHLLPPASPCLWDLTICPHLLSHPRTPHRPRVPDSGLPPLSPRLRVSGSDAAGARPWLLTAVTRPSLLSPCRTLFLPSSSPSPGLCWPPVVCGRGLSSWWTKALLADATSFWSCLPRLCPRPLRSGPADSHSAPPPPGPF